MAKDEDEGGDYVFLVGEALRGIEIEGAFRALFGRVPPVTHHRGTASAEIEIADGVSVRVEGDEGGDEDRILWDLLRKVSDFVVDNWDAKEHVDDFERAIEKDD